MSPIAVLALQEVTIPRDTNSKNPTWALEAPTRRRTTAIKSTAV